MLQEEEKKTAETEVGRLQYYEELWISDNSIPAIKKTISRINRR